MVSFIYYFSLFSRFSLFHTLTLTLTFTFTHTLSLFIPHITSLHFQSSISNTSDLEIPPSTLNPLKLDQLILVPSESICFPEVAKVMESEFANIYAEGQGMLRLSRLSTFLAEDSEMFHVSNKEDMLEDFFHNFIHVSFSSFLLKHLSPFPCHRSLFRYLRHGTIA